MERENAATHSSSHCWIDMVEQEAVSLKEVQCFEYYPVVCLCVCVCVCEVLRGFAFKSESDQESFKNL